MAPFQVCNVCCIVWDKQSNAGEIAWVVTIRETWQVNQPNYHSDPEPGLSVGSPQHLLNFWTPGACEGDEPADPKQQNLHYTAKHWDTQEESQWEPVIGGIAEARGLEPDKWLMAINTFKERWLD